MKLVCIVCSLKEVAPLRFCFSENIMKTIMRWKHERVTIFFNMQACSQPLTTVVPWTLQKNNNNNNFKSRNVGKVIECPFILRRIKLRKIWNLFFGIILMKQEKHLVSYRFHLHHEKILLLLVNSLSSVWKKNFEKWSLTRGFFLHFSRRYNFLHQPLALNRNSRNGCWKKYEIRYRYSVS